MAPHARLIAVSLAGLLALSLAPTTFGQAAPPVSLASVSAASSSAGSTLAVIATVDIGPRDILAVGAGPNPGDPIYVTRGNNFVGFLYRINPVTLTVDDSVAVGRYPFGLAVSGDDTVYVVNADDNNLSVINGATMSSAGPPVPVPDDPKAVALSRVVDDTVFVSSSGVRRITTLDSQSLSNKVETSLANSASHYGLAVASDDSVYITSYGGNSVYRFDPGTATVSTFTTSTGLTPIGIAISDDDTVYVASEGQSKVHSYAAADSTVTSSISVSSQPQGVAIGPDGRVLVASRSLDVVSVLDPVTLAVDDTILAGDGASSIARTSSGLMVVGNRFDTTVSIISSVSPSLGSATGRSGSTTTIALSGLPAGVLADDSTVDAIFFGGVAVSGWTRVAGTNSWSGPVPDGTGSVPVSVALQGGNTADLGTFTYTVDPPPVIPAGPPTSVTGVAGDASASVRWAAPASTGSFPVTNYQVMSSPAGASCLTTVLTCEVTGLTNGTDYSFSVRALTGAGWSSWSQPSAVVAPKRPVDPSIMITGSRGEVRGRPGIIVSGTSTGMGMGAVLAPWMRFDDQTTFSEGKARILVDESGDFTWQRRTQKTIHVQLRTPDGSMTSNTITISRR